jgi:hypothetical protein
MAALSKVLDARLRRLKNYRPVVIIVDRERRSQPASALVSELCQLLNAKGHRGQYIVGMPDRMIENWILADWEKIVSVNAGFKSFSQSAEGLNGKAAVKRLLPSEVTYHETTVGVALFLQCRSPAVWEASESFRRLVCQLNIKCSWLKDIHERFQPSF